MTKDMYQDFTERQERYFRFHYRWMVMFCLVILVACTFMTALIAYRLWTQVPSSFFVSTTNGDLVPLTPASQPALAKVTRSKIFEG
ncbi:MAG: hypothetical protein V4490_03985 [Pseudomonadota bacterium]